MSVQAITWAYKRREIDDAIEAFILVTLANFADPYGVTWPSQKVLARDCRCSERKVRYCLAALERRGLIARLPRRRDNGSRKSDAVVLVGFQDREPIARAEDHPILEELDVEPQALADTINRHPVPPDQPAPCAAPPGTVCRTPRHHVPAYMEDTTTDTKIDTVPPTPRSPDRDEGRAGDYPPTSENVHADTGGRGARRGRASRRGAYYRALADPEMWRQAIAMSGVRPRGSAEDGALHPGSAEHARGGAGMAGKMRDERLAMARDPETRRRLMTAERLLSRSVIPAEADEVRAAVAGLLCHYPDRGVPPDLMPAVMRDWIDDLGRFPPDILRTACQAWRRGDNAYAPAPGQIIALAEPIARMREFYLRLAREALAASDVVTDGQ